MPIYIKYGDIKGQLTAEGHKGPDGWCDIHSCQFGVGRGISTPTGSASKRESSAPSISEVTISKTMDASSPFFFQEALIGLGKVNATIDFVSTDEGALRTYLTIELTQVMLSGYSLSSGGDRPSESMSINFTKILYRYIPTTQEQATSSPIPVTYDIALGKKV